MDFRLQVEGRAIWVFKSNDLPWTSVTLYSVGASRSLSWVKLNSNPFYSLFSFLGHMFASFWLKILDRSMQLVKFRKPVQCCPSLAARTFEVDVPWTIIISHATCDFFTSKRKWQLKPLGLLSGSYTAFGRYLEFWTSVPAFYIATIIAP
jgi:hypothetical protein